MRGIALALAVLSAAAPALAGPGARRDIAGIGLGMTAAQVVAGARVTCRVNKAADVSCTDPKDGSEYKALFSGGKPSIALSVKHSFCSAAPAAAVLAGLLKDYGVSKGAVRPTPNGSSFTIGQTVEATLNSNSGGGCPGTGTPYQFSIRDDSLMRMGGGADAGGSVSGLGTTAPAPKP